MGERPMCEGCGRPMPLTDEERRAAVDREFWEFEVTGVLGPELARAAAERAQPTGSQTQGGRSNG